MNTSIQGMTVMDIIRGIVRLPREPHSPIVSVCDSADDGHVIIHGPNVDLDTARMTVLETRATMQEAGRYLRTFVALEAARGVRYVVPCANAIRIEVYLNPLRGMEP